MTPALGALAQVSDALTRAAADAQSGAEAAVTTTIDLTLLILGPIIGAFVLGLSVILVVLSVLVAINRRRMAAYQRRRAMA